MFRSAAASSSSVSSSTSLAAVQQSNLVERTPFFYGWVVLIVSTLGLIMTSPGQTYSVSIFNKYIRSDLGIDRTMISTLYLVGTLVGSFALPLVGRLIDSRGARLMMGLIAAAFGLSCIFMGFVQNIFMLGVGFALIRMLGQGSLSLVSTNAINQWWVRRRGMMLGLSGILMAILGTGSFPLLLGWLIPLLGWRWAYAALGLLLLLVVAPLSYIFIRNRPEDHDLQPDGKSARQTALDREASGRDALTADVETPEESWTQAEALRTLAFWAFSLGVASTSMLGTGLTFHVVQIFEDNGLSEALATGLFLPLAIAGASANLISGLLVDRMPVRILVAVGLLLQTFTLWIVGYMDSAQIALLFMLAMGATFGLLRTVGTVVWAAYFGRRHLGSISGTATTIGVAASALGPLPMGYARDAFGSFQPALIPLGFLPLALAVVCLFVAKPKKNDDLE